MGWAARVREGKPTQKTVNMGRPRQFNRLRESYYKRLKQWLKTKVIR